MCRLLTPPAATGKRSLNTRGVPTSTDTLARFLWGPAVACVSERVCDFLWHHCVNKPERYRKARACAPGAFVCLWCKKKIKMKRICSFERKRKGKSHNVGMKQRPPEKASDQQRRAKGRCVDAVFLRIHPHSYQLPRQEHVLLPSHHQRHALSLLGAAQHGHQLLLATACHVYSVYLHTNTHERGKKSKHTNRSRLKLSVLSTGSAPLTRIE